MNTMFCQQCEQTAGGKACTAFGACGKTPDVAALQDGLTADLVTLARALHGAEPSDADCALCMEALFMTLTNTNFDHAAFEAMRAKIAAATARCGGSVERFAPGALFTEGGTDERSLRSTLVFGLRGMAAYAWHAHVLGRRDAQVSRWFFKGLYECGRVHSTDGWLALVMELGKINFACMAFLDSANTGAFGHPAPTRVSTRRAAGPFIVVTGHDLHDLKELLEQTDGSGVNVFTHGEMLPAHAYPRLKKYTHLRGHYGHAWQMQQSEFAALPAPMLFTTNCLMPPRESYMRNIFTASVVD